MVQYTYYYLIINILIDRMYYLYNLGFGTSRGTSLNRTPHSKIVSKAFLPTAAANSLTSTTPRGPLPFLSTNSTTCELVMSAQGE